MDQIDTDRETPGTSLVSLESPVARNAGFSRTSLQPAFVSQLLAARAHLPSQRLLRRAESGEALSAYDQGKARGVRRLPAGSYSTRIV